MRKIKFVLAALFVIGIGLAVPSAEAHPSPNFFDDVTGNLDPNENDCDTCHTTGDNPHVPDAWWSNKDHIIIDKDSDVGDGWHVNEVAQNIDENTFGIYQVPALNPGECENTTGPCWKVHVIDNANKNWYIQRTASAGPPIVLNMTVNKAYGPIDRSPICRLFIVAMGEHTFFGNGCAGRPWTVGDDFPSQPVFDEINHSYSLDLGQQL